MPPAPDGARCFGVGMLAVDAPSNARVSFLRGTRGHGPANLDCNLGRRYGDRHTPSFLCTHPASTEGLTPRLRAPVSKLERFDTPSTWTSPPCFDSFDMLCGKQNPGKPPLRHFASTLRHPSTFYFPHFDTPAASLRKRGRRRVHLR